MTRRPLRHAVLLAALFWLIVLATAAIAHAHYPGRIAFDNTDPAAGTEEISVIDADGANLRPVTTQAADGATEIPAWDRQGIGLFYDGDAAGNVHVFHSDLASGRVRQITATDGFEFAPAVSRDGKLFAFEHDEADSTNGGIYVAPLRGETLAAPHQITVSPFLAVGGFDSLPDFSPDGTRLTFMRVESAERFTARSAIFVVNVDGTGLHQLTPFETNAIFPRWSPDGTRIAFSTNGDNFNDQLSANVFTIRPDGTGLTQMTHESAGNHAFTPDWSPDASMLVFAHATAGDDHTDLDILNLRNGRTTVLLRGAPGTINQDPAWSPTR